MYERSAIVLERYFNYLFGLQKEINLKTNYQNYISLVEEVQKYQTTLEEEEQVIKSFDEVATKIQEIQKKQEKLSGMNIKLEEERNRLFSSLDESPSLIEKKLEKIENTIENNTNNLATLKDNFIEAMKEFSEKQIERNKCSRTKRLVETNYIAFVKQVTEEIQAIDVSDIKKVKIFLTNDDAGVKKELIKTMSENGKNEKIKFDTNVIEKAVTTRIEIAKKEAEAYLLAYDKMRRFLGEIDSDTLKISKYQKTYRDLSVKFAFLEAEKEYIVGFLDNERMTVINGSKMHAKMMKEACKNFDLDMTQIKNLYDLILREIAGKSTKKAYNELYNKTYLQEIEDKEKNFEEEVNHMKIKGTVINSNYWRIEGIKNIYEVFQKEVSEKFEKDLSEYKIEEPKEIEEDIDIFGENGDILDIEDKDDIENDDYEEDDSNEDEIEEDEDYIFDEDEEIDNEFDEYEDDEEFEIDEDENNDDYEEDEDYDESDYDEDYDEDYEDDDELEDEDYEDDYDDTEEAEYYEDEEDNAYDENEYEDDYYEEDEEENYEEDEEEELRTAKIASRARRENIDDRLAKYKKKMNEEKQSKGFLGFFKDRKNKQF